MQMPPIIHSRSNNSRGKQILRSLIYSCFVLYVIYILFFYSPYFSSISTKIRQSKDPNSETYSSSPTSIGHVVFGIAGSTSTWKNRIGYLSSWWRSNITRGYIFLEKFPNDTHSWPSSLPPFRISQDTSKYKAYDKHRFPHAIRLAQIIAEVLALENKGVRWFILADDDTVFFINNLVDVLARYDHEKYYYIGMNSECHASNFFHSFDMAFGGAGYALSYPLAQAVVKNLDFCIKRYPSLYGSDHILGSCVADLGVSITQENGFHQIDMHNDTSGYLSVHPQSPLLTLHHFDAVDPIFPSMNTTESLNHLMRVAKQDESRLLQQTICYHKPKNWSLSISFGYSVHIYESIILPSILRRPLETFTPWSNIAKPFFLFNTRVPNKNPCEAPHVFFFNSINKNQGRYLSLTYTRRKARGLPACASSGNHSADSVSKINVISDTRKYDPYGSRRECCDVLHMDRIGATIKLRNCLEDEILP